MGAVRLEISLSNQSEWLKMFDPRDWTITVPTDRDVALNAQIRIDLDVGGWLVTLRGTVVGRPAGGVTVALGGTERDKINYLNGFVRGGLLNLRAKRRLPVRLEVTYGAVEGPATTFTKDINEEGVFLFTDQPLPETSQVHMLVSLIPAGAAAAVAGRQGLAHDPRRTTRSRRAWASCSISTTRGARRCSPSVIVDLEARLHAGQAADQRRARVTTRVMRHAWLRPEIDDCS